MARSTWQRLREATAATAEPSLLRGEAEEPDADDEAGAGHEAGACPSCDGTGLRESDPCSDCDGAGTLVKESTNGPYWLYSDDPDWEQLREADHPQWEEMSEAPRTFSGDVRKKYAASGVAMPDGSYPIPDKDALKRAVSSYGHNPTAAVKAHIKKRAAALGASDSLPDDWGQSKEAAIPPQFKKNAGKGKKDGKGKDDPKDDKDGKGKTDDKDGKDKPPWLKGKESEVLERLDALEGQIGLFKQLREAKPASMTPTFSTPTRVKTSGGQEGYKVILIREGKGNKDDDQWYTADAIKEMCESGVAEGMQAYGNHPDLEEEELRPERDVKELIGTYHDVKFAESGGKARADAIFVPLTLDEKHPRYGWVVTLAEAATRSTGPQPICGISLYGLSAGDDGERPDQTFGRMVNMIRPSSGDIVTNAGAGGGFIRQLMESARALRQRTTKEQDPMKLMAYQNAVREAVKRVREASSDEESQSATEALAALEAEQIDMVPDSVEKLREAAPQLVDQIERTVKESASAETKDTVEELREANQKLNDQLKEARGALSQFTDAIGITDALREAGVESPVELRHFAGMARQRGLREAADIKDMVETERAMDEKRQEELMSKMRESLDLEDTDIEGAGGRMPVAIPDDGGLEMLRESGLPLKDAE